MDPDKTRPGLISLDKIPLGHTRLEQSGPNQTRSSKARQGFLFLPHLVDTSTSSAFACVCLCVLCVFDRIMEPDKNKPGLNIPEETPLAYYRPKQTGTNQTSAGQARPGFLFLPHLVDTSTSSAFACVCLCVLCVFDRIMEPDKNKPAVNSLEETPLGHARPKQTGKSLSTSG